MSGPGNPWSRVVTELGPKLYPSKFIIHWTGFSTKTRSSDKENMGS